MLVAMHLACYPLEIISTCTANSQAGYAMAAGIFYKIIYVVYKL